MFEYSINSVKQRYVFINQGINLLFYHLEDSNDPLQF